MWATRFTGTLSMLLTEEGYATFSGTPPTYHYYLKDHQGNNRVVIKQAGAVQEVNHYYPFGGSFGEGTQPSIQRYKYNGKESDREMELDLYNYGARHYDPVLGRWFTVDPMAEKYYSISPYIYVANNPARFIDPNGKRIVAVTTDAQRMTLNTLPQEYRQYVSFNESGVMNTTGLVDIESNSSNFNAMRTMALSDMTMEVKLDNKFDYLSEDGNKKSAPMKYLGIDTDFIGNQGGKGIDPSTGETGFLGKTLFPDKKGLQNSTNGNIIIVINSGLTEKGRAEIYSHEANGHAYVYIITNGDRAKASHQYAPGGKDSNTYLFNLINRSTSVPLKLGRF